MSDLDILGFFEQPIYPLNGLIIQAFSKGNESPLVRPSLGQLPFELGDVEVESVCDGLRRRFCISDRRRVRIECLDLHAHRKSARVPIEDRPPKDPRLVS